MNQPIFEIKQEKKQGDYAQFTISPLEQGYGNTLGSALRRVLLTSLSGSAITSVKITGVKHQFSTLKGMKEDVVEFVLNLKKVRTNYKGAKSVKASLSVKGAGEVKAKDIKVGAGVEVSNPDLVLAHLNKGAKLDATLQIESGKGYVLADEKDTRELGLILIDTSFSPVIKVNYRVEETRVGRLTNYDKLVLEIWTDGTIKPKETLVNAAEILTSYFNQIVSPKKPKKVKKEKVDELGLVGKLSVEEIGLPTRVANALVKSGYETVEALVNADRLSLVKVRNLGEKSIKIVDAALGEKGVKMKA